MKIGFVFTNYNNSAYTKNAVASIAENEGDDSSEIVIVDNASEESDVRMLREIKRAYPKVNLILSEKNLGYFKGLNLGIEYLKEHNPEVEYLVVGNNDLVFPSAFYSSLKKNIILFKTYPVVSPNIIRLDGIHQNPHVISKVSKIREIIYDIYYSNYQLSRQIAFFARITRNLTKRRDDENHQTAQVIAQGYGACYILGPLFIKNFGQLWAPTFLMAEELFLSLQLKEKEYRIFYEPSIIVHHHDHATVNQLPSKRMWNISKDAHKIYRQYVKGL